MASEEDTLRGLFLALRGDRTDQVEELLNQYKLSHPDDNNLLYEAVNYRYTTVVELLLKKGFDVNIKCGSPLRTVLHAAIDADSFQIVKMLLVKGADINAEDHRGETPLHVAVRVENDLKMVQLLLKYGANVNAAYNLRSSKAFFTPLHLAIEKGNYDIVQVLLKHKGNIYLKDKEILNYIVLLAAIKNGFLSVVEELLQHGLNINVLCYSFFELGYTPLHIASKYFRHDIAKLLINHGAYVNAIDDFENTPIYYSIENDDLNLTRLLLTNGADVISHPDLLNTAVKNESKQMVEILLRNGVDVNASDCFASTALHSAAQNNSYDIAKLLLKNGADVEAKTKDGDTALHIAAEMRKSNVVWALLEYGADINITNHNNYPPLELAVAGFREGYNIDLTTEGEIITLILKHQIIKMMAAGLYVSENNLQLYDYLDEDPNYEKLCAEELNSMKREKISDSKISYYELFTKSVNQLTSPLRNENISENLKLENLVEKFSVYAFMLHNNCRKAKTRQKLLEQGDQLMFKIFPKLTHDVTQKVFNFLSIEDLSIFVEACQCAKCNNIKTVEYSISRISLD